MPIALLNPNLQSVCKSDDRRPRYSDVETVVSYRVDNATTVPRPPATPTPPQFFPNLNPAPVWGFYAALPEGVPPMWASIRVKFGLVHLESRVAPGEVRDVFPFFSAPANKNFFSSRGQKPNSSSFSTTVPTTPSASRSDAPMYCQSYFSTS